MGGKVSGAHDAAVVADGTAAEEGAARALDPADWTPVADVVGVAGRALLPGMAPWGPGTRTTLSGAP
jgi:hypothetical protein